MAGATHLELQRCSIANNDNQIELIKNKSSHQNQIMMASALNQVNKRKNFSNLSHPAQKHQAESLEARDHGPTVPNIPQPCSTETRDSSTWLHASECDPCRRAQWGSSPRQLEGLSHTRFHMLKLEIKAK